MLRTSITSFDNTKAIIGQISASRIRNVKRGAEQIRDKWADLAPQDSGEYADSIEVRGPGSKGGYTGAFVVADATNQRGAPYPIWVEYGSRFAPAQPAARPAADAINSAYIDSFRNMLR